MPGISARRVCAPWARLLLHQLLRGDGAPAWIGAPSSPVSNPFPSWCCAHGCPALAREDPQPPQCSEAGQLLAPVGYKSCPNRWGQRVPGEEPRSTSQGCKAVTQLLCCSCFLTRVTFPPPPWPLPGAGGQERVTTRWVAATCPGLPPPRGGTGTRRERGARWGGEGCAPPWARKWSWWGKLGLGG